VWIGVRHCTPIHTTSACGRSPACGRYGTLFGTPGQAPDDDADPPVPGFESSNDAYTGRFNGTSSASPIVAAAAGIVSSVAQQENELLTPAEVRDLLVTTGTPQDTTTLGALPGNIGPLPNLAAALGLEADLAVTKVADPDPVAAGALLTYTVTVTNAGPNVAVAAELLDELPDDVTYVGTDPRCQSIPGGDVLCDLGDLGVGASTDVDLPVAVPASLVHDAGGPVTLTNEARVGSSIDDPNLTDNVVTLDSQVVAVADLAVNGVEVAGVPGAALVGEDIDITVTSLVGNLGPSSPMDATLTTTATPSAGASVDPADVATPVPALAVGPDRPVDQAFTMRCDAPGQQQVVFDVEIAPAKAADTDPNSANNTGQVTATLECVTPIALNIRPAERLQPRHRGHRTGRPDGGAHHRGGRVWAADRLRRDDDRAGQRTLRATGRGVGRDRRRADPQRDLPHPRLVRARRPHEGR
jgi:uncharacterized repeat protein (TIGR01451 family)